MLILLGCSYSQFCIARRKGGGEREERGWVDLRDLTTLMVASYQGYPVRIPHLQQHQKSAAYTDVLVPTQPPFLSGTTQYLHTVAFVPFGSERKSTDKAVFDSHTAVRTSMLENQGCHAFQRVVLGS